MTRTSFPIAVASLALASATFSPAAAVSPEVHGPIYVCVLKQLNPGKWSREADIFIGDAHFVSIALALTDAELASSGERQLSDDDILFVDEAGLLKAPVARAVVGKKATMFYANSAQMRGTVMVVAPDKSGNTFTGVITDTSLAEEHQLEYLFSGPCFRFENTLGYKAFLKEKKLPDFFGGKL